MGGKPKQESTVTKDKLVEYVPALLAVMRTLNAVEKSLTYGEVAQCVGFWDGKGNYPRSFNSLIRMAMLVSDRPQTFWQWMVRRNTGLPGTGYYN